MKHDLNLLRVLVALADHARVASVADTLEMTQPGVSNALKRLRVAYKDQLFVRTARGMIATPYAEVLIIAARQILDIHAERMLGRAPFNAATARTAFHLAMSDIGEMVFLPRIIEHLQSKAPSATLQTHSSSPGALDVQLENGSVDLAVGFFPDLSGRGIYQKRLFSHGFACLLRADHPVVGDKITRRQFLAAKHISVHAEGRSQEVFENYLAREKIVRNVVLQVPHFMSIPLVVAKSDLIATVPRAVGASFTSDRRLKVVPPPFDIPQFTLMQHWHERYHKDARNVWLRNALAALFNDVTDEWRI